MATKNLSFLRTILRAALVLLGVGSVIWLPAANRSIGIAAANGSFQVDHSRIWGNATLFDGSVIETALAPSDLKIGAGVKMRLASGSRATVYERKLVLESGVGQLESAASYEIEARSLHISAAAPDTVARVRIQDEHKVTVAALRGGVRVTNAAGLVVARLESGASLDFEPQPAGAAAPTRASGCLLSKSGKLVLAEQTTNVVLEVEGPGLEREVGNRVEITGIPDSAAPSVAAATQVIKVAGFRQLAKGGCGTMAKKVGATTAVAGTATAAGAAAGAAGTATAAAGAAAGAAAAAGIGAGTMAVIGGVAAAATVGGLAAAGSLPGQSESQPSASR